MVYFVFYYSIGIVICYFFLKIKGDNVVSSDARNALEKQIKQDIPASIWVTGVILAAFFWPIFVVKLLWPKRGGGNDA